MYRQAEGLRFAVPDEMSEASHSSTMTGTRDTLPARLGSARVHTGELKLPLVASALFILASRRCQGSYPNSELALET